MNIQNRKSYDDYKNEVEQLKTEMTALKFKMQKIELDNRDMTMTIRKARLSISNLMRFYFIIK